MMRVVLMEFSIRTYIQCNVSTKQTHCQGMCGYFTERIFNASQLSSLKNSCRESGLVIRVDTMYRWYRCSGCIRLSKQHIRVLHKGFVCSTRMNQETVVILTYTFLGRRRDHKSYLSLDASTNNDDYCPLWFGAHPNIEQIVLSLNSSNADRWNPWKLTDTDTPKIVYQIALMPAVRTYRTITIEKRNQFSDGSLITPNVDLNRKHSLILKCLKIDQRQYI